MQCLEKNVVAIVGPTSSMIAHVVANMAKGLQVPLLSFAATDPTLSTLEYPFFVRTGQNDYFQMAAIADIVDYFGWRKVTAIYNDDDFGRNGIAVLEDMLSKTQSTISYKAAMNPEPTTEDMKQALSMADLQESRIIILHTYTTYGLKVLEVARSLHMLDSGYVWIATDWLTDIIDTDSPLSPSSLSDVQGLLTLRLHTPQSDLKKKFMARWSNLVRKANVNDSFGLNIYGLYAYDTVWVLARALDEYFSQGGNISFSNSSVLSQLKDSNLHFDVMKVFDGGQRLLSNVRRIKMKGVTGNIQFDSDRNLINPAYDIVNVVGSGHITIGYWSNSSGLSVQTPEALSSLPPNLTSSNQQLHSVIWPGQTIEKPRGWVFPINGKRLKIGVPYRVDYDAICSYSASTNSFKGYVMDVFTSAVNLLPYALPYTLVPFGNGIDNPNIDELVDKISTGVFDAVIGDIPITTARLTKADFTQPFIESGLVVVAPVKTQHSNAWAFLSPFTPMMWGVTFASFVLVGSVIWILEHRHNDEFRGPPRQQFVTMLWFTLSTWFFSHQETTVSTLGRFVLVVWLFVVLIINSSYTASLTSILTVQQLSSPVKGIQSLVASNKPIGYREGSFVLNYLNQELSVPLSRLVALKSENESAEALRKGPNNGGIAAIVDLKVYSEIFLSTRCEFSIIGQEFTRNGWGFAFPRGSQLAVDMSTAILRLSENGDLQRINDKWLQKSACSSQDTQLAVDQLQLNSFWGIYLIIGITCLLALLVYFGRMVHQYIHHYTPEEEEPTRPTNALNRLASRSPRLQTILSFVDEKEEETKRRSKKRQMEGSPSTTSATRRFESVRSLPSRPTGGSRINNLEFSPT
ncbi:glutamate receptor 3.6-like isoform X2 [Silene latifolia]